MEAAAAAAWFASPCVMGIDEAGRGPVLGPMVYGCAYCAVAHKENLAAMHFADSKTLTDVKREELFNALKADSALGWAVDVIDAKFLSAQMLRRDKISLNAISFASAMGLIKLVLNKGVLLSEVYVDTVGDPVKYQAMLTEAFPHVKFTVAKKADSLYPIVSAASIVAKVTRDKALREWTIEEKGCAISREFGSGYPADPGTKAWLQQHMSPVFGFPSVVRFSWATCKPLMAEGVQVFWEAEEEEESSVKKPRSAKTHSSGNSRHSFFESRHLQQVTTTL